MHRALVSILLLVLLNAPLAVADVHVGLGPVDEVEGVGSKTFTLSWETDATHPWEFMLGGIDARDDTAMRTPRVWFASVSKRFTWNGWFAQGGIAATNSDTDVLSEHWQFMTGLGYRYQRFTVSLRHLSNANTGGRNRGENLLLLQYGF
ncbi:acyloxyacyl hydrolase [Xanthomonadaceae bacterium JHOS43]|nr:acyloxyacyl hydrolase [Xanthomonadaceae bacterium JHOS43]MCX7561970.1 acyloxyacyl hydrolase [Xanthomonadaceae bacterium XH05]